MRKLTIVLAAVLCLPAQAATPDAAYMFGVWSLGETKNCDSGPARVFLADGYYAEVTLPDSRPSAIGLWKDEGSAIA